MNRAPDRRAVAGGNSCPRFCLLVTMTGALLEQEAFPERTDGTTGQDRAARQGGKRGGKTGARERVRQGGRRGRMNPVKCLFMTEVGGSLKLPVVVRGSMADLVSNILEFNIHASFL